MSFTTEISRYNTHKALPRPSRSALLVVDMQKYFTPVADPILSRVVSLVETCRKCFVRIFFTRQGHIDPKIDGGMLGEWWGDLIMRESDDWQLMEELGPAAPNEIIDKTRYSAFFRTSLNEILRAENIEEILITGVLSNCACETTARDAFVRDYRVFFVSDATATVNKELHIGTLRNLAYGSAHVLSTEQLRKSLETGRLE